MTTIYKKEQAKNFLNVMPFYLYRLAEQLSVGNEDDEYIELTAKLLEKYNELDAVKCLLISLMQIMNKNND